MSAPHSNHKKGQGLIEYALIFVLVALVVFAALMLLGPMVGIVFSNISSSLANIEAAVSTPIPPGTHVPASGGVCPPGSSNYHIHSGGTHWCIQN